MEVTEEIGSREIRRSASSIMLGKRHKKSYNAANVYCTRPSITSSNHIVVVIIIIITTETTELSLCVLP